MARLFPASGAASAPPAAPAPAPTASAKPAAKTPAATKPAGASAAAPKSAPKAPKKAAPAKIVGKRARMEVSPTYTASDKPYNIEEDPLMSGARDYVAERQLDQDIRQKLTNVRALREQEKIGRHLDVTTSGNKVYYPSLQPIESPTGKEYKGWTGRMNRWFSDLPMTSALVWPTGFQPGEQQGAAVRRPKGWKMSSSAPPPVRMPTDEQIDTPYKGVEAVRGLAKEYADARYQHDLVATEIDRIRKEKERALSELQRIGNLPPAANEYEDKEREKQRLNASVAVAAANNAFPYRAKAAREALQKIAMLRAELREFGWMDDDEVEKLIDRLPGPATPSPKRGWGDLPREEFDKIKGD